jgi:hypothetical protein
MLVLERVIEAKRFEMINIAERNGLSSTKTIKCSQELDKLLNLFNKQLLNGMIGARKIS